MEQKNKFIYILPVMFGFFIMGFCDLVGISVTYAKEQFQWTETQAGFLPSMVFLWFFILSVPTAMLMNRIGRKNTVLLSMLFTFAGMVLPFIDFSEIPYFRQTNCLYRVYNGEKGSGRDYNEDSGNASGGLERCAPDLSGGNCNRDCNIPAVCSGV